MSDPITQATSSSLLHYFVRDVSRTLKKNVSGVSPRTMAELTAYHWPGNVRELKT